MPKVLFTASVVTHLEHFHVPYMRYFRAHGFTVHTAAKGPAVFDCTDRHFEIGFERSPLSIHNISCYRALKKLIDENRYDIIHCHTPVVSVLTRLAARKARKNGTVVVYTAHGFHFYQGAPRLMATFFKAVEKWLSRYTDYLITINREDFEAVSKYGFKPGACYMVPGVGVDTGRFLLQTEENKTASREEYGIAPDAFVLVFAAEYSPRKNQQMLMKAVDILKKSIPNILLLLPGEGSLRGEYEAMIAALGLQDHVRLMGFRRDMERVLLIADIAVSSSVQEGLPINMVEAMAVSLPVVATRIRGHVDLIEHGVNGFLVEPNDAPAMAERILYLYRNPEAAKDMRCRVVERVKPYLLENAAMETIKIYEAILKDKQRNL